MEKPPGEIAEIAAKLEQLAATLKRLERRVQALEGRSDIGDFLAAAPATKILNALDEPAAAVSAIVERETYLPAVGKAVLGIAGAYLLRAAAESGLLPFPAALALAMLYSVSWMVAAARAKPGREIASIAQAITAILIFVPMLWETTMRFHVLPAGVAAAALFVFAVVGMALAWSKERPAIAWIATLPIALTALALLLATRDLLPFTSTLVAIAAAAEYAACRDRWAGLRWIAALTANVAILSLVVVSDPSALGAGIAFLPIAFLAIYAASTVFRTVILGRPFSWFEVGQPPIAFALMAAGVLRTTQGDKVMVLGCFTLLASGACYWLAFRNGARAYAVYGVALLLAGATWVFPVGMRALVWSVAALLMARFAMHSAVYLLAAAYAGGLLGFARQVFSADSPATPGIAVWIVAAAAVACYWMRRDSVAAALTALSAVALGAYFAVTLAGGVAAGASIRTFMICAVALGLAYSGSRWSRAELIWIARAAMALGALKLFADDFRHAGPAAVAVSLLCYGAVLILMPRWTTSPPQ